MLKRVSIDAFLSRVPGDLKAVTLTLTSIDLHSWRSPTSPKWFSLGQKTPPSFFAFFVARVDHGSNSKFTVETFFFEMVACRLPGCGSLKFKHFGFPGSQASRPLNKVVYYLELLMKQTLEVQRPVNKWSELQKTIVLVVIYFVNNFRGLSF